jgi:hypothetical protein
MRCKQFKDYVRHLWKAAVVLCCALLLIFGTTLQVAHIHTPADVSHAGCALCATAHVVISPSTPLAIPLAARQTADPVADQQTGFPHRLLDFSLYKRPPPVAIAFS